MKNTARFLLALLTIVSVALYASADEVLRWDFTNSANYTVSNQDQIEVADGVARLKLKSDAIYHTTADDYFSNAVTRSTVRIGYPVNLSISRTTTGVYRTSGVFDSRALGGGSGNSWQLMRMQVANREIPNSVSEMSASYSGLLVLLHLNNSWAQVPSGNAGLQGAPTFSTDAKFGSHSAYFDGNNSAYFGANNLLNGKSSASISFWIKLLSFNPYGGLITSRGGKLNGFVQGTSSGSVQLRINDVALQTSMTLGKWHHIVGTWSSSTGRKIYIDGELKTSASGPSGTIQQNDVFKIAYDDYTSSRKSTGYFDEIAVVSRELSEKSVQDLYALSYSVRFQIRSSATNTFSSPFIGSDGTSNSYITANVQTLSSLGLFDPSRQYVQYRAYLGSSYDGERAGQVGAVSFEGSSMNAVDYSRGDFLRGTFVTNTTVAPLLPSWSYVGLSHSFNGGYFTNGTFTSRILDAGDWTVWNQLSWVNMAQELDNSVAGMVALWPMNGSWADTSGEGHAGTPSAGVSFVTQAKLGSGASAFDGVSATVTIGDVGVINTIEFWLLDENLNDGLMEFTSGSVGTPRLAISNGWVLASGFSDAIVYVNGRTASPKLMSGWNHVVVVTSAGVDAQNLVVGLAGADYLQGILDGMAIYDRSLDASEIREHYVAASPSTSGRARFRLRWGDTIASLSSNSFVGPGPSLTTYYTTPSGAALVGMTGRYIQYRMFLTGDGQGTPGISSVSLAHSEGSPVGDESVPDFGQGTFDEERTFAYGEAVSVDDLSAFGVLRMRPAGDASLRGLWHMDEDEWDAGQSVTDSSGHGRDGVPNGGASTVADGKVGLRAGHFDGVDDYVTLQSIDDLDDNDFTAALWFRTASSTRSAPISSYDGDRYFTVEMNGKSGSDAPGFVSFLINDSVNGEKAVSSVRGGFNDGRWHHVAAVRRARWIHIYVDGERLGSTEIGLDYRRLGDTAPLLAKYGISSVFYEGYLDEVAVFLRALSPGEIGALAGAGHAVNTSGTVTGPVLDAGLPAIWNMMAWGANGVYGHALSADMDQDLVGLWHLDEVIGDVMDSSPKANDGTVYNVTYGADGQFSNALSFAGTGDFVEVPDDSTLEPDEVTVEAWVFPTAIDARTIADKRSGSSGFALATDGDGKPYFWLAGAACTDWLPLIPGIWSHVAGSYDGSMARLYVNGELRATSTPVGVTVATTSPLRIGRAYNVTGTSFEGRIDEVAVHKRALLSEEILDHYRAGELVLGFQGRSGSELPLTGEFVGPDSATNTFFSDSNGSDMVGAIPLGRYFQYKCTLLTPDHRFAPVLQGLRVDVSGYATLNPYVESILGHAFLGDLVSFAHGRTWYTNTDVQYQVSGDTDVSRRWFYWDDSSGQWSNEWGMGYSLNTSPADDLVDHLPSLYDQLYDKTGGVFRFRTYLHSEGDQQVEVDWVEVLASEGRIVVVTPNGQERGDDAWIAGVEYDIEWTWEGVVSDYLVVEYTTEGIGSDSWTLITNNVSKGAGKQGSLTWRTPSLSSATNCYIRIRDPNDVTVRDVSDRAFSILQRTRVTSPNGGEIWYAGTTNNVVWESGFGIGPQAQIDFAGDGEVFDFQIAYAVSNQNALKANTYAWKIPSDRADLLSTNARIRVQKPGGAFADASDDPFTLAGVVITSPQAGRKVKRRDSFTILWTASAAGPAVAIDFSSDGGLSFTNTIYPAVTNTYGTNSFTWDVQEGGTDEAMLRIRSLSDSNLVGYSKLFALADIDVTAPDGGEDWLMYSTNTITWTAGGAGDFVSLYYSTNSGGAWMSITSAISNTGSHDWVIPNLVSRNAQVKIVSDSDTNLFNDSEEDFNIAGVRVTYPDTATHRLEMGQQVFMFHDGAPLRWTDSGVTLEISYEQGDPGTYSAFDANALSWGLGDPFLFTPAYPSSRTKVRVTVNNPSPFSNVYDESDEFFTTAGILMTSPTNGSVFTIGGSPTVGWVSAGVDETAYVYYSNRGTNNFSLLTSAGVGNNQVYPGRTTWKWNIATSLQPSTNARIKVVSGSYVETSAPFVLRGIRITAPASGSVLGIGRSSAIAWVLAAIDDQARGSISLSMDGGADGYPFVLATNMLISGSPFAWDVAPDLEPTTNAVLKMTIETSPDSTDMDIVAYSDVFTLRGLKVTSPTSADTWVLQTTNTIGFIAAAAGSEADIYYSADGGATYESAAIASDVTLPNGSATDVTWAVEWNREPSTNAVVLVEGTSASGTSEVFTVAGIYISRPMQYDIWAVGEPNLIKWASAGVDGISTVDLVYESGATYAVTNNYGGKGFTWTMPSDAIPPGSGDTVSNVLLRVRDVGGVHQGWSEPFKIVRTPRVEIVSPASGAFWKVDQTKTISWLKGGQMTAADFRIFYSQDGFVTSTELTNAVSFDATNNLFSSTWHVPDELGATRILVTSRVNTTVFDLSSSFDVAGNLRVQFPNGEAGEKGVYALSSVNATWGTKGSVGAVDLYYKYASEPWTKINTTSIGNNGEGLLEQNTVYSWKVPNALTGTAKIRVQDANYTNIFDGTMPGPYDDSDSFFSINYYTVYWDVFYIDEDGVKQRLDSLSVVDSSGWSESDLSCVDDNGLDKYIIHSYPYGTFDSAWYREYFNSSVDFHWLAASNHIRQVEMTESEVEQDYYVLSDHAFDVTDRMFSIHSWLERSGGILTDPSSCTIQVYDSTGTKIFEDTKTTADDNGVFWQTWDVTATELELGVQYVTTDVFFGKVTIKFSGNFYTAGVTFALRLAAGEDTVAAIEDIVSRSESNILDGVESVATNLTAVGAKVDVVNSNVLSVGGSVMSGISNLTSLSEATTNKLGDVERSVTDMTNSVLPAMDTLTNQMVSILEPIDDLSQGMTNLTDSVTTLAADAASGLARILTRPTTVVLGSTNSILYKTRSGYDSSAVSLVASNASRGNVYSGRMREVVGGIYEHSAVVNWGVGSYTVTCSDPFERDSMTLSVVTEDAVSGAGGDLTGVEEQVAAVGDEVEGLSGEMVLVETSLRQIEESIRGLGLTVAGLEGADMGAVEDSIAQLEQSLASTTVLTAGVSNQVAEVEKKLGSITDSSGTATLFGVLTDVQDRQDGIAEDSADGAKDARSAKTEATAAGSSVEEVRTLLTTMRDQLFSGDQEGMVATLAELRRGLRAVQDQISGAGGGPSLAGLQQAIASISAQIRDLALKGGLGEGVAPRPPEPEMAAGGVGDAEGFVSLRRDVEALKDAMEFVKQMLQAMQEPVVTEALLGAE